MTAEFILRAAGTNSFRIGARALVGDMCNTPGKIPTRRRSWAWVLLLVWTFLASDSLRADDDSPALRRRDSDRPVHLLAVLIGGIESDPTPAQMARTAARDEGNSGLYRLAGDIEREPVIPEYFNWNGTRAGDIRLKVPPGSRGIAGFVRRHVQEFPGDRIAIVGNSWGGHTALEVLQQLAEGDAPVAVNLAVFLDGSSAGRGPARPKALPVNVNRAVN